MSKSTQTLNAGLIVTSILLLGGIVWVWPSTQESSAPVIKTPFVVTRPSTTTPPAPSTKPSPVPPPTPETPFPVPPPTASIKNEVRLAVPFTSQAPEKNWDEPWQNACEEAALLMLDAYYKKYQLSPIFARDELLKVLAYEENLGYGGSIDMEKIKKVAIETLHLDRHGTLKIIEDPGVEDIKAYIAAKKPVLVVADGKKLPNPNFQGGGPAYHALIITGYTEDTFITNDPGTRLGKDFEYHIEDLMGAIRDWNGGNVKTGRRVILVVE